MATNSKVTVCRKYPSLEAACTTLREVGYAPGADANGKPTPRIWHSEALNPSFVSVTPIFVAGEVVAVLVAEYEI